MRKSFITNSPHYIHKLLIGICLLCMCTKTIAQNSNATFKHKIDSLKLVFKNAKHDTIRMNVLIDMSSQNLVLDNFQTATSLAISATKLAVKQNNKKGLARSYCNIGWAYTRQGDYKNGLKNQLLCLTVSREIGYENGISGACGCIGAVYYQQGDYKEALEYSLLGLKYKEKTREQVGIAAALNNIGSIYNALKDHEKALEFYLKALELKNKIGLKKDISSSYNNIANIYYDQGKKKLAMDTYSKAISVAKQYNNKNTLSILYNTMGSINEDEGDVAIIKEDMIDKYKRALDYYFKSLAMKEEINSKSETPESLICIGRLYMKQNKVKESFDYLKKALSLTLELGQLDEAKEAYNTLYKLSKQTKNYKQALEYYRLSAELKDSVFNETSSAQIAEMTAKYETEKKDAEIILLNKDKQLKDVEYKAKLQKQTLLRNVFIIGFVLVLLLVVVSVFYYKQKLNSTKLLSIKNEEIAKQTASIDGQMKERKRLAKELHDGIGGSLAGIKLSMISSLDNNPEVSRKLEPIVDKLSDVCLEVRAISHDLALPVLSSNKSYIEVINNTISAFQQNSKIDVQYNIHAQDKLNTITENIQVTLYRLLQELIHNITKHSNANKVEISLSINDDIIYLIIEDNGVGFDGKKVFKGLGLTSMKTRVQDLNGSLTINTSMGKGTVVNIEMPAIYISTNTDTV